MFFKIELTQFDFIEFIIARTILKLCRNLQDWKFFLLRIEYVQKLTPRISAQPHLLFVRRRRIAKGTVASVHTKN
jgi:hypothetical protein